MLISMRYENLPSRMQTGQNLVLSLTVQNWFENAKHENAKYERTEGHITKQGYILFRNEKTAPKLASQATFAIAKSLRLF